MKQCKKCHQTKEFTEFYPEATGKGGLKSKCKECVLGHFRDKRAKIAKGIGVKPVSGKTCTKCGEVKVSSKFFRDTASSDGLAPACKECKKKQTYVWRENNKDKYNASIRAYQRAHPEARYGSDIKRRYGCTLEQYNAMIVAQNGKCAICDTLHNPAEKRGRLYVDHCHKGGQIRALLCGDCNSMLGYAKDNPRVLLEAVAYLSRHQNKLLKS